MATYALIVVVVAIAAIAVLTTVGSHTANVYNSVNSGLAGGSTSGSGGGNNPPAQYSYNLTATATTTSITNPPIFTVSGVTPGNTIDLVTEDGASPVAGGWTNSALANSSGVATFDPNGQYSVIIDPATPQNVTYQAYDSTLGAFGNPLTESNVLPIDWTAATPATLNVSANSEPSGTNPTFSVTNAQPNQIILLTTGDVASVMTPITVGACFSNSSGDCTFTISTTYSGTGKDLSTSQHSSRGAGYNEFVAEYAWYYHPNMTEIANGTVRPHIENNLTAPPPDESNAVTVTWS